MVEKLQEEGIWRYSMGLNHVEESMKENITYFEELFKTDEEQFIDLKLDYAKLNQENIGKASQIATRSLILADRWSEISFQMAKMEKLGKTLSKDYRKRSGEKYKTLMEIHTHARVIWGRGEERVKR
jgi:hypothetical protein